MRKRHSTRQNTVHQLRAQKASQQPSALRGWLKKDGWALGGTLIMLIGLVWYVVGYREAFAVTQIKIEGQQFVTQEQLHQITDEYMNSKSLVVIPHNSYFTLNTADLHERITSTLNGTYAFESIDIQKDFPHGLSIRVTERIPSITWITSQNGQNHAYLVDRAGYVTQALEAADKADPAFPAIYDANRDQLDIGAQIISSQYIDFVLQMQEMFSEKTGIRIDSYAFPAVKCQEKEYVAEKIFEQAQESAQSEEFKQKQRKIQEQFQNGELTIDESLEEIEKLRQEELTLLNQGTDQKDPSVEQIHWEAVYKETPCDYVRIGKELHIDTNDEDAGFAVYMDSTIDPVVPIENLNAVLVEKIEDRDSVRYVDIRYVDRVYYQ